MNVKTVNNQYQQIEQSPSPQLTEHKRRRIRWKSMSWPGTGTRAGRD